jgi:predicted RecB family nuclease
MNPPSPDAAADPDAVRVRLGPTAAGRCPRRVHLDAAQPHTPVVSAAGARTLAELREYRTAVLTLLDHFHPPIGSDADWRSRRYPVVTAPAMTTATRSGGADLLLWSGDGYLPVIVRAHRTRDAGSGAMVSALDRPSVIRSDPAHRARRNRADRLALAHHYRQLVELGCAASAARGGVIGRGGPTDGAGRPDNAGDEDDGGVIVWHDLGAAGLQDYDIRFRDRIAIAEAAVAGRVLAQPSRIADCRRCHWWPVCSPELQAAQDISLLLSGDDVRIARSFGVATIPALAGLPGAELSRLPFTGASPVSAQVRARAWVLGVPLIRAGAGAAANAGGLRRAAVELDVDAESYGEDGPYLWGAELSGADVGLPRGYRSFVTWDQLPSVSQAEVFGRFFDHLRLVAAAARSRGLSFAVFCYGRAAEERWMQGLARRYEGVHGVPGAREVADFTASPQWVDLLQEIKRSFLAPGSLRLKDIAGRLGFTWRDPEPGGENSMAWYRAVVGPPRPGEPGADPPSGTMAGAHPMAERILRYNEDDVLATLAVRRWITDHLTELPTVADLASGDWMSTPGFGGRGPTD